MAFNGSGTFNRVYNWVNDANNSINITASRMDTEDGGFATGLSNCLCKDGQQVWGANQNAGSNKITNLANGSASGDSAALGQVFQISNNLSEGTAATIRTNIGCAASGANTDITSVLLNQTGLVVKGATANALTVKPNETMTAARTLNIVTGDATRSLTFTADTTIGGTHSGSSSGTNTGDQTITLTGDVTGSGTGSFAATIASSAVTNAKMANMNNNTIKGNVSGGAAAPSDLTASQVKTLLGISTFSSLGNAFSANTAISVAHGLGAAPVEFWANIRCTSNDTATGYVTGDVVTNITMSGTNTFSVFANATNVAAVTGGTLVLCNKGGSGASAVTSTGNFVIDLYCRLNL